MMNTPQLPDLPSLKNHQPQDQFLSLTQDYAITLSYKALEQIKILQREDYTLQEFFPRVAISGKGCGGFTYALTFGPILMEDIVLIYPDGIKILLDRFTAYYFKRGSIDFVQNYDSEGFVIKNNDEELFQGKFYQNNLPIL